MANNIIDSIRLSGTTYQIQGGSIAVDTELDSGSTNPVQNKVIYNKIDEVEEVTAAGLNALNDKINPTVELTQAEYEALTEKDPNTYYIITDAEAGDLTNYYTKSETNTLLGDKADTATTYTKTETNTLLNDKADTATTYTKTEVDTALNGKQATLVSGTNIKTINNTSILGSGNIDIQGGGGGKAVSGGTNISITTGETADTINCTLRAANTSGTGSMKLAFLSNTDATGVYSVATGYDCKAKGSYSFASGRGNNTKNYGECAVGFNNKSVGTSDSISKNSGCTLFSVGNGQGTSTSSLHNAFEVRQNGDIYITLNDQDVKLQDQLGGGGSITVDTALDSGSTNPVQNKVIYNKIDEVEQVTAAGLNALNDNFGGLKLVKLTQAEYNALATKDSSTLYIIVN